MTLRRTSMQRQLITALILIGVLAACAGPEATPTAPPAAVVPSLPAATATLEVPAEPTAAEPTPTAGPTAVPTARPDEFINPVYRTNFPDPHIIKVGETYYAYATNGASKNVQAATSTDLVEWERLQDAMPSLATWIKLSSADVWAPEVMQIGEQFMLYYTARDKASGKQCVGVAVSDKPEGKFKDTRDQALVCQAKEGGTIDASPFRDGDKLYLLYKNDGNCCGIPTYIYIQEMAADGLSLLGEPVRLVRNDRPWERHVIEAPTMFNKDGKYYLFFSANDYGGFEYAVGYATCESVTGPCQDALENPILASIRKMPLVIGPGHQTLVQVEDQTWIVYHAWEWLSSGIRGDRRMMWIDRLDWVDGKPVVRGPTTGPQQKPID